MADSKHWNYRVIEFRDPTNEILWRAIHAVHYVDNRPTSYAEGHASIVWDTDEGDHVAAETFDWMREALSEPVLIERDFAAQLEARAAQSGDEGS